VIFSALSRPLAVFKEPTSKEKEGKRREGMPPKWGVWICQWIEDRERKEGQGG